MKFGVCTSIEKAQMCLEAGFDFIETNAGATWAKSDEELDKIAALNLPIYSANCMFPSFYPGTEERIRVVGPERKPEFLKEYYGEVMRKCAKIGIKTVVFGSGGQRRIPEGFDTEEGLAQYREVCTAIADYATKYGITIVVEPLNYTETNSINTVKEGFEQVKIMNHESVKLLMDIYHVLKNEEDIDYSDELIQALHHVHWSNPETRKLPQEVTEWQKKFAKILKDGGYDGVISIETASPQTLEEAKKAREVLRDLFE
ncbi:MAG: sugar phosphate isomerase/epimerase [Clostridia bacterium]|nr:sugar phosphate isomerase/epimerase [Clostridia bacterium]